MITGAIQILLTARSRRATYEHRLPPLRTISAPVFVVGVVVVVVPLAIAVAYIYSLLFAFYGLFLSFFAEMEPHSLFGRNGFINSDFFTPVVYLAISFWPMAAGTLIANGEDLFRSDPWKRMLLPSQTEIVRVHVLVVVMPIIALLAWALFGDSYHGIAIVLLMGLFYLLPRKAPPGDAREHPEPAAEALRP